MQADPGETAAIAGLSLHERATAPRPRRVGQDFSMRWPNLVPCCVYRHWRGPYGLDDVAAKGRMPMSRALRKNLSAVGRGNKRSRICLAILPAAVLGLNACGDQATLPASAGFGPSPQLPPAHATLIPTVNIAPANGWQGGTSPVAAPGLRVVAFAEGLDHPRWLYVLPNGDVLVAETNAPPKPEDGKGIKGWIMSMMMGRAGAGTPSANRITLLRDANGDGVAQLAPVFLEGLNSPFGMALVGDDLYVANTDAVVRFPYHAVKRGSLRRRQGRGSAGGPINHHWTKNVIASARWAAPLCDGRFEQQCWRKRHGRRGGPRRHLGDRPSDRAASGVCFRAAQSCWSGWEPRDRRAVDAVNERDEIGSDLVPDYMTAVKRGCVLRLALQLLRTTCGRSAAKPPRPDLVATAIAPDYALGAHTASLGLAFSGDNSRNMPIAPQGPSSASTGLGIGEPYSGYKVVLRAIRRRAPGWPTDGHTDRVSHCRWQCARSPGRRRHRQCGSTAGRRRCRQSRLACDRIIA